MSKLAGSGDVMMTSKGASHANHRRTHYFRVFVFIAFGVVLAWGEYQTRNLRRPVRQSAATTADQRLEVPSQDRCSPISAVAAASCLARTDQAARVFHGTNSWY
jgi:hypothetical protein